MTGHTADTESDSFETDIPARMDRLPWSSWHWMIIVALGVTWVLDGLEVTIKGAISGVLQEQATLNFTSAQIGSIASIYLVGAVVGALFFGYLTDRLGRKRLFYVTLGVYLTGVVLTALAWDFWSFALFRALTGLGIGGEYAAINSAVDEMIPARVRGHADLAINGSYWLGAAVGAVAGIVFLGKSGLDPSIAWRATFGFGAILGLIVLFMRKYVPESPRWLMTHGKREKANEVVSEIEETVREETGEPLPEPEGTITIHPRDSISFRDIAATMWESYRKRAIVGFSLFVSQAFLYNAIFFTYALVLTKFYNVPGSQTAWYLLPFALTNFLGAILLGRWFDTIGRRKMIAATYSLSGLLLVATGYFFINHMLSAMLQTALWSVIFFIASPAASSAYLTVSETFPLETRAMSIAFFYAIGTAVGGVLAPALFGKLIGTGSRMLVFYGYAFASGLMIVAAAIEWFLGVNAEQRSLEDISSPLSSSSGSASGAASGSSSGSSSSTD